MSKIVEILTPESWKRVEKTGCDFRFEHPLEKSVHIRLFVWETLVREKVWPIAEGRNSFLGEFDRDTGNNNSSKNAVCI